MNALNSILIGLGIFVGSMVILASMPVLLGYFIDPINKKRIKKYCESVGCAEIKIDIWPNHYGVSFKKSGAKHYAKCQGRWGHLKWKGKTPEEF